MTFLDGSRVTPGTERCNCDQGGRLCEMPCWQRLGLTASPCNEKHHAPCPSLEMETEERKAA